ncbi:hypothetical protein HQ544_01265, partial [Candidatus Falkowbacteria bacterium]|nr:hypothetical protein [Candidatus Falkowbacteria bacterium]
MINSKYEKSIQFIESLINNPGPEYLKDFAGKNRKVGTSLSAEARRAKAGSFFIKRLKYLLKLLGNPENSFKYIHIAGTSGKSSLTCMLQSILTEAGLKTGAYFSPHPTYTTERIKVGHNYISENDFAELTNQIKPHLSKCASNSPYGIPSYFETLLAISLLYFKKQKCKYVVLEAGLGGTFDATNIIPKPEIAIITNVDLDHTDILGNTKQKIARDKAGIIKKGTTFLTAEQDQKILKIFKTICKQKNAVFNKVNLNYQILKNNLTGTKFEYQKETYKTKLPGDHQIKNAILAIEATDMIIFPTPFSKKPQKKLSPPCYLPRATSRGGGELKRGLEQIERGLKKAFLPCRMEIVQQNPTVILDGAHNPDKMKSTANFIKNIKHKNLHLILALAENKDLYNTLKHIVPLASRVYLTRFLIPGRKAHDLKKMAKTVKKLTTSKVETHIDP